MAWGRKIELTIGSNGIGVDLSALDISFSVSRSISYAENTADFSIFNAAELTRKKILKKKNNLIFKAGYEDEEMGTIFIGNIAFADDRKEGSDIISKLSAVSARKVDASLKYITVSLSYAPGTLMSDILRDLATALGVVIYGTENAAIPMDNGWTFSGSVRAALSDMLQRLKSNRLSMYIDNSELVIYRQGVADSRYRTIYLDYNSGLISVEERAETGTPDPALKDKKRISFKSILIPEMQPNATITIGEGLHKGVYIVEKLKFEGDNFGGSFNISGEASA